MLHNKEGKTNYTSKSFDLETRRKVMLKKVLVVFIFVVLAVLGVSYFGLLTNQKNKVLNWYKTSKKDYGIQKIKVKYKQKKYPEANNCILTNKKLFEE
jgi:Tfp pilus assembly protein PilO